MVRWTAALLLLSFSFTLIGPAVFADQDSQLPACCRNNGKHGCSMTGPSEPSSGPSFRVPSKCPYYSVAGVFTANGNTSLTRDETTVAVSLVAHAAGLPQAEARSRISFSRSWYKRGPPLFTA